ncbi:MAG: hypothetical protein HZC51_09195 [Nitrospirae bacterium]|nr:hypothetical protein [Nitrospirota bacterium]
MCDPLLKPITLPKLLFVEGKDEENLAEALLKHLQITDVDIRLVNGKDKFKTELTSTVKSSGFYDKVTIIGILRDAEDSFDSTFQSMNDVFASIGLDKLGAPLVFSEGMPRTGVFIAPDNKSPGMLETLCLRAIQGTPAMACVEEFYSCASKLETPPNNPDKTRMQAYLATLPKDVRSLGVSAQKKGFWDFNHEAFAPLRGFLENFR